MREKTGLQRQIREIFGDEHAPIKRHPSLSPAPRPGVETPHGPMPRAKEEDTLTPEAVRPPDSRHLEIPPKRPARETVPQEALPASSSVQLLEQRYRSPGTKTLATRIKGRAKVAVALALAAVLVWQLAKMAYPSSTGDVRVENGPKTRAQPAAGPLPGAVWPLPNVYPQDIRDPMEWKAQENPTNPQAVASTPESSRPVVRGILYSQDKPRAIIGTEIVGEGDVIQGATIVKIGRKSVEFEMNGQKWIQEVETSDSQ